MFLIFNLHFLSWYYTWKVSFLVLVYVFNFDLFEFSATILEKGLLQVYQQADSDTFRMYKYKPKTIKLSHSAFILNRTKRRRLQKERQGYKWEKLFNTETTISVSRIC